MNLQSIDADKNRAYPSGEERGVFYSFILFLPALAALMGGGRVSTLCLILSTVQNHMSGLEPAADGFLTQRHALGQVQHATVG
jgi:hypothetical protein